MPYIILSDIFWSKSKKQSKIFLFMTLRKLIWINLECRKELKKKKLFLFDENRN